MSVDLFRFKVQPLSITSQNSHILLIMQVCFPYTSNMQITVGNRPYVSKQATVPLSRNKRSLFLRNSWVGIGMHHPRPFTPKPPSPDHGLPG